MTEKTYLVVLDTTEATMRQTVGMGILNVHVIRALDPLTARNTFLRVFSPFVRNQIQNSIYIYELEKMMVDLKNLQENKMLPLFSFLPLSGGRPPKPSFDGNSQPVSNLGNTTLESNVNTKNVIPPQQVLAEKRTITNNARSTEFQDVDLGRPLVSDKLTKEQAALINNLGARPTNNADEGVNQRINSSVGRDLNISRQHVDASAPNTLNKDQMELLNKFSNVQFGPEIIKEDTSNEESTIIEDPSLSEIDNKVLSEEDIIKLNKEIEGA